MTLDIKMGDGGEKEKKKEKKEWRRGMEISRGGGRNAKPSRKSWIEKGEEKVGGWLF